MSFKRLRHRRPRTLRLEELEPRWALAGNGLYAQYFHNEDFTGLAGTRVEAIDFNWGEASPGFGMDADAFSVRWSGQIEPEFSQTYTFRVLSDEGVRLWVNGQLLIDDWEPHLLQSRTGTIALSAGQKYDIRLDYYDLTGSARIELSWSSASQPLQLIPASRLYESPAGLLGTYRDSNGGSASRIDSTIDFNWGLGSPITGIASDGFTINWTGQLRSNVSGLHSFSTISDDGVRLWIGGELVIDNWTVHPVTEDTGTKLLEVGKWYDVRLEHFDETGISRIELRWAMPGENEFEVIPHTSLRASLPQVVKNPLGAGADPFVIYSNDQYYMVRSVGNSIWINRADSLEDIHDSSPRSVTTRAWTAPPGTNYSHQIWAPELHRWGSSWYIYVAASDGNNATHRMHVLVRTAEDPYGEYTYVGQITPTTDRWAIDGTVLEWDNKRYFVWSGWAGFTDGQQNLYIAEMRQPWLLNGDRVLLSTPQYAWEKHGLSINEGPQILIEDGQLHIIYSASGYWTPQYALGRLTYNGSGSLLDPSSWTKATQPVFQRNSQVVGVGHASFTTSPDGNEHWIVYHAHANPNVFNENRVVRIQPFTFHSDGTPNFGTPITNSQILPVPSAGTAPERPFVFGDFDASGDVEESDRLVWVGSFGEAIFPTVSADANGNGVVDAADYVLWRKAMGSQSGGEGVAASQTNIELNEIVSDLILSENDAVGRETAPAGSYSALIANSFSHAQAMDEAHSESSAIEWLISQLGRPRYELRDINCSETKRSFSMTRTWATLALLELDKPGPRLKSAGDSAFELLGKGETSLGNAHKHVLATHGQKWPLLFEPPITVVS